MPRGWAPAGRDLLEGAFQGWEWPWEDPAPSPWQAQPGWNGSLQNVCLNHAKVIKVYDLIKLPIPLWSRSDHPSQFSALFPDPLGCSGGFIPISTPKPANTSLHFCTAREKTHQNNPVHLHIKWAGCLNIRAHIPQKLWIPPPKICRQDTSQGKSHNHKGWRRPPRLSSPTQDHRHKTKSC